MKFGLQTWGSQGDVEPFLALAAGLVAAGHEARVVVTTQSDKELRAPDGVELERVGVPMTGADGGELFDRIIAQKSPIAQAQLVIDEGVLPSAPMMFDAARKLAADCDIVVRHHFLYMTRIAAALANTPEVSVFLTPDLLPTRERPPTGMPSFGPLQSVAWWMANTGIGKVFAPPARALCDEVGLPRPRGVLTDVWPSDTANFVAVSPTLCPPPSDWSSSTYQTGFWRGPSTTVPISDEVAAFLADGESPVYASFGSMSSTGSERFDEDTELLVGAARAAGRRLILQQPGEVDVPGDDVLVVQRAPHAVVFPKCAAVIHHGGAGTTQTVVRAGVPSIVVPHLADQFFWADQVERLGAGTQTAARRVVKTEQLAHAIQRVCDDDEARRRVAQLGVRLDDEQGIGQAVEVLAGLSR